MKNIVTAYRIIMANIHGFIEMMKTLPHVLKESSPFDVKIALEISRAVGKYHYYYRHEERKECGCSAIGNYYTAYSFECITHMGWLSDEG